MPVKRLHITSLLVCIGKILRTQGVEGELKVLNYSDVADRYHLLKRIYLGPAGELAVPYSVAEVREQGKYVYITLAEHDSVADIKHLQGQYCFIPEEELAPLSDGHFYVKNLLGLQTYTVTGEEVGRVIDILQNPANDILVVEREQGLAYIPMVEEFIEEINVEQNCIRIKPIEGLLDTSNAY